MISLLICPDELTLVVVVIARHIYTMLIERLERDPLAMIWILFADTLLVILEDGFGELTFCLISTA